MNTSLQRTEPQIPGADLLGASGQSLLLLGPGSIVPDVAGPAGPRVRRAGFAITVFSIVSGLVQAPMGYAVDRFGATRADRGTCARPRGLRLRWIVSILSWILCSMVLLGVANAVYHPADYAILGAVINRAGWARPSRSIVRRLPGQRGRPDPDAAGRGDLGVPGGDRRGWRAGSRGRHPLAMAGWLDGHARIPRAGGGGFRIFRCGDC